MSQLDEEGRKLLEPIAAATCVLSVGYAVRKVLAPLAARKQRRGCGPAADPQRALNMGEAAHITAASPGGPRYDSSLTPQQRCSIENAIWLCPVCARLIDTDERRYPPTALREWKQFAEDSAAHALRADSRYRPIAATEVRSELSIAEIAAFKELEEEFGCHVETEVLVPSSDGWLRFQGAVVRGEDLVGIDVREHHGKGIPYFQIEYLLNRCVKLKFLRFQKCVVYLVVVSDGLVGADAAVQAKLEEMLSASGIEGYVRVFRLNELRAKFSL